MFVGRALYDSRIIDLHFNKVFLKTILGDPVDLSLDTLRVRTSSPDFLHSVQRLIKVYIA